MHDRVCKILPLGGTFAFISTVSVINVKIPRINRFSIGTNEKVSNSFLTKLSRPRKHTISHIPIVTAQYVSERCQREE